MDRMSNTNSLRKQEKFKKEKDTIEQKIN